MTIFQMLVLVLPAAGIVYTTTRVGHRFGTAGWRWSDGSAPRRGGLVLGTVAAVAVAAFFLWPRDTYRPIQPGERGTLAGAVKQLTAAPSGRAALTPERVRQLGGAPTERKLQRDHQRRDKKAQTHTQPSDQTQLAPSDQTPTQTETQPAPAPTPAQPAPSDQTPTQTQTQATPPAAQPAPSGQTQTTPTQTTPTQTQTTPTPTTPTSP
jgi:hypothetical protein